MSDAWTLDLHLLGILYLTPRKSQRGSTQCASANEMHGRCMRMMVELNLNSKKVESTDIYIGLWVSYYLLNIYFATSAKNKNS